MRNNKFVRLCALAAASLVTGEAPAEAQLPRRASLGVALEPADAGMRVRQVVDAGAAAAFELRPGDVIKSFNDQAIGSPGALTGALKGSAAGAAVKLAIVRDGLSRTLSGRLAEAARERYSSGTASYGAMPFQGGHLRDIFVTPPGGAKGPVLFLIQGYTCDSVENVPVHMALFEGLLARGVAIYRIEKPGAGDSRGHDCQAIDFETEMAGFESGYRKLIGELGIAPDRIFLLGHSMGGIQAPLLAARGPTPRGVAVYGTVVRSWADYLMDILKMQGFQARGADPAEAELGAEEVRDLLYRSHVVGEAPATLAGRGEKEAKLLRDWLGWDGKEAFAGRHWRFWHQLTRTPLLPAWRDTRSNVLSLYGESDFAALSAGDQRLIVDVVNHYRPGTARFVELPRTGHSMRIEGSPAEVRAKMKAGQRLEGPFNADLIPLIGDWIRESMARPAVAAGKAG